VETVLSLVFFLNNECVNIYLIWYQIFNFLLDERDANNIDLDFYKGMGYFD